MHFIFKKIWISPLNWPKVSEIDEEIKNIADVLLLWKLRNAQSISNWKKRKAEYVRTNIVHTM